MGAEDRPAHLRDHRLGVQVRLWEGATEPTTWNRTYTYTDTAADRITGAGTVEIAHSSSTATNTAYVDNLTFTDATATAAVIPTTTNIAGPAGLLVTDTAGTPTYPLVNPHGDIVGTTDSTGTIGGFIANNPAGDEFGSDTTLPASGLGWLGGHQRYTTHANSKNMRMGARIYDPNIGRFTNTDPLQAGSANAYDYASGDPINSFDPDGHCGRPIGNTPVPCLDPSGIPPLNPRTPSMRDQYAQSLRVRGLPADHDGGPSPFGYIGGLASCLGSGLGVIEGGLGVVEGVAFGAAAGIQTYGLSFIPGFAFAYYNGQQAIGSARSIPGNCGF